MNLLRRVLPVAAPLVTAFIWVLTYSPFDRAEGAFIFLAPLALWLLFDRPRRWLALVAGWGSGFVAWLAVISWLRHVTWAGTILLAAALAVFFALWVSALWWSAPRLARGNAAQRLALITGLAAAWVVLEWTRSTILTGFPWLPLAASQWQQPALLQIADLTGAWGTSFLLVFINLALASYLRQLGRGDRPPGWWRQFVPEFYAAMALVIGALLYVLESGYMTRRVEPLLRFAAVQPYAHPSEKWDDRNWRGLFQELEDLTLLGAHELDADLILWPESATPGAIGRDFPLEAWLSALAREAGVPILGGFFYFEGLDLASPAYNAATVVRPEGGLDKGNLYAKRRLVPYGEYIPLADVVPGMRLLSPVGDLEPGKEAKVIPVEVNGRTYRMGALICYEDAFPRLAARTSLLAPDFLFVVTNNIWYGREGGAYQHAAHSVLRAIETRRPVLRCGNGGWSGWIDAFGQVRGVARDARGSIYFEGVAPFDVARDRQWVGRTTLYARHGDWFVLACALTAALGLLLPRLGVFLSSQPEKRTDN